MSDATDTLKQMLSDKAGQAEVALHAAKSLGVNILSGIKGLSVLPTDGPDAAADAIREYQKKYGPGTDLSPRGVGYIQHQVAPVYQAAETLGITPASHALSKAYGEGSQELSDIAGKYLGPKAAGVVGAAADAAPYAITEGGLLGKDALPELGSYLELTGKYPSYTKTTIPTAQLDPALHPPTFTPPDGAESVVAMDPETGRQVAHVTYVPRGDGVQGLRMDTDPDWRGKGIASDLLRDAISQAHDRGLPYRSDTQVSIPAARVYEKVPGAARNDAVDMSHDPHDGDVGVSGNGRPIYEVPRPVDADDAQVGEEPHFDPNGGYEQPSSQVMNVKVKPLSNRDVEAYGGGLRPGNSSVSVIKNPTPESIARWAGRDVPEVRFMRDTNGDVYAWDANDAIHRQIQDALGVSPEPVIGGFSDVIRRPLDIFQNLQDNPRYPPPQAMKTADEYGGKPPLYRWSPQHETGETWGINNKDYATNMANRSGSRVTQIQNTAQNPLFVPTGELDPVDFADGTDHNHLKIARQQGNDSVIYRGDDGTEAHVILQPQDGAFADGGPVRLAGGGDGGELAPVLDDIGALVAKYAHGAPNDHAAQLADAVKTDGGVTYNPTTGDVHTSGYAVPSEPSRSVALDSAPSASDIHDFMLQNQDAFDNPKAALHIESDGRDHFMHVAHIEPDFEGAMAAAHANDLPGIRELHTGINFPSTGPVSMVSGEIPVEDEYFNDNQSFAKNALINEQTASRPLDEYDRIHYAPQKSVIWTPGKQTVTNPVRNYAPGIYDPTRDVVDRAAALARKSPEDPMMQRLFGVTRQDLADIGAGRQGNLLGQPKDYTRNPGGSQSALNITNPRNAQRLVDALDYSRSKPELSVGMTGWYVMDPAYQRILHLVGDEDVAKQIYDQLNTYQAVSSPQTPVDRELNVAGTAHWLRNAGRWGDYQNMVNARRTGSEPADLQGLLTHVYHNSQNVPAMNRYNERGIIGSVPMDAPKAYVYGEASNVPEIGTNTRTPVGDTHFSSALGLLDTRTAKDPKGSVSTEELQTLAPWFRSQVADRAGYESVPAQANLWAIFAPETGVRSGIGMPKLEMMTQEIKKLAARYRVSPETARDMYLLGQRP